MEWAVRCLGAFKRIPTPESTLITNMPGPCGRRSAHGWAVADGEPAELELIGNPDGWRPKDPQVKSSPTLEKDGPDGGQEEETEERGVEGNQHSNPARADVDTRGELKVHGAQRETDNKPHDQENSQKHATDRRRSRSVDARRSALRRDTSRPKQPEYGPEGNRGAQGAERPNRLETSPRRAVPEEQHERGIVQSPLNFVKDEPLRPPVDPDPSWEWRRGSRSSRTRRCYEC